MGGRKLKMFRNFFVWRQASASGGGAERQNSAFGFSLKKVRISFRVRSQIGWYEFSASGLRPSAGKLAKIFHDFLGSKRIACERKTWFATQSAE